MANANLEDQISDLVSAVNKLVGAGGNSAPQQGGGAAAAQQNVSWISNAATQAGNLAKETVPLIFGFKRLTEGSDVTATALQGFSGALKSVGLSGFGGLVGSAGEEILKQKTNLDALNKETGAAGLNIGRYVRMAGEAGVTTQQFNELIKGSNGSLMGLGLNSSHSAEVFSKVNRELVQSEIGSKLMQAGISSEDMAKYTAISLTGMRRRDLESAQGQAAIQKSAAALSQTLLESSAISGQNRDAMAKNLQAELEDTDNIVEMSRMSQEQRNAYIEVQAQAEKVGPAMGKLVTEIYNNDGVITSKGIAMTQAMGPAGQAMEGHIKQLKALEGQTGEAAEKQRANIKRELELDQARGLLYIQQDKTSSKQMSEEQAAARNELIQGAKGYFNNLTNATADSKGDLDQAMQKMKTDAKFQTEGKTPEGKDDAGARITMAMNEANQRATIQAGGMAQAFEKVVDKISTNNQVMDVMKSSLDIIGKPGGKMDQAADKFMQFPDKFRAGMESVFTGKPGSTVAQPTSGVDASGNILPKANTQPAPKKADGGIVPGTTEGTTVTVGERGKPEAIVPLDQISKGINVAEISKTISTSFSSVTGGSTETKRVQNDDSKNAEKELQIAKEKYAIERQTLLEKTQAALGPNAGRGDVRRAMNSSDEGKALEEKYQSVMDPLYKRIDAGVSYETTRKQEAIEESKKIVEEQVRLTKNGNLAVTAATKDGAEVTTFIKKNEIAETLKQAELQKSVIGKNVKDMSDEMLESILPKGTKVEDYYEDMNGNLQSWANDSAKFLKEKSESSVFTTKDAQSKILETENLITGGTISAKAIQAEVIKKSFTDELIEKDKANQQNIGKVKELTTAELIERDKANVQNVGKIKEPLNPLDQLFASFSKIGDKIAPEIKKAESKSADVANKQADLKKTPEQTDAETKRLASANAAASKSATDSKSKQASNIERKDTTLKDLNDQLVQLNKQMVQLINYNSQISEHTQTTARTKPAGQRS